MVTSVLLADFQYLTRQGMSALVRSMPDFDLIETVENVDRFEASAVFHNPHVIITDISDKDHELLPILRKLTKVVDSSFLVISNSQTKQSIQELLAMGIKGILTKNCCEEEIINGLRAVVQGNRFFCNNILDFLVENPEKEVEDCEPTNLSRREYEVLQLIAQGKSTAQIADQLHLSVHTINSHRKNILKKLNLKTPAELIVYALDSGLVKL